MCQLPLLEPKKKCCGGQILFQTLLHTDGKCDLENCHGSSLPDKSFVIYGKWWLYHVQNLMASCLTFGPSLKKSSTRVVVISLKLFWVFVRYPNIGFGITFSSSIAIIFLDLVSTKITIWLHRYIFFNNNCNTLWICQSETNTSIYLTETQLRRRQ